MLVVHSNTRYETEKSLLTGLMSFCTICFYGNDRRLGLEGVERQRSKGVGVRHMTGSLEAESLTHTELEKSH